MSAFLFSSVSAFLVLQCVSIFSSPVSAFLVLQCSMWDRGIIIYRSKSVWLVVKNRPPTQLRWVASTSSTVRFSIDPYLNGWSWKMVNHTDNNADIFCAQLQRPKLNSRCYFVKGKHTWEFFGCNGMTRWWNSWQRFHQPRFWTSSRHPDLRFVRLVLELSLNAVSNRTYRNSRTDFFLNTCRFPVQSAICHRYS